MEEGRELAGVGRCLILKEGGSVWSTFEDMKSFPRRRSLPDDVGTTIE